MTKYNKHQIFTIPNVLSFFRLCLIPYFIWLYIYEKQYIATGFVLIISGLSDIIDGFIARRFNMISDVGKILDPIADKCTQLAMLICLMTRYPAMIVPTVLLVVKEIIVGISGWLTVRKTRQVYGAKWHGKINTVLLYAMMILHVFWIDIPSAISYMLIFLSSGMMLISFMMYGRLNFQILKENAYESAK